MERSTDRRGEYRLGVHEGQVYIECLTCRMRSFNANDIRHCYCNSCLRFHEGQPARESH